MLEEFLREFHAAEAEVRAGEAPGELLSRAAECAGGFRCRRPGGGATEVSAGSRGRCCPLSSENSGAHCVLRCRRWNGVWPKQVHSFWTFHSGDSTIAP